MMSLRGRVLFSERPERASQESKVTSTPQNRSPIYSLSPSISTIACEDTSMDVDDDEESSGNKERETVQDVESLLDESESEGLAAQSLRTLTTIKNIKWVGFWSSLKPKNRDSLYYKIMTHPAEVDSIATDLVNTYKRDEKAGINLILQLFVDLCGYRKLVVGKVYNCELLNAKQVVTRMESELMEPELKKTGKFIFMKCSKFESVVDNVITDFSKSLALRSFKTGILFDEVFTGQILEFLNCMAFSTIKCIRITGVILVIKFLTAFVNLYNQFLMVQENSEDVNMPDKKAAIETFIDFLYLIYDKNCLISDKKCYPIKIKCTQEIYCWIKVFPDIFIFKRRCLGRLMKLIVDQNELVRESALNTCEKLVSLDEIVNELKERIDLCLKIVSHRIFDVNGKVALKAIAIFTKALDRYASNITKEYKLIIVNRMFEDNILIAKAAGKFLGLHLQRQNKSEEEILMSLLHVCFLNKKFSERLPNLLESCIEFIPQLKSWNAYVKIILNDDIELITRKHFLEVLSETIRYSLTGKFSINRVVVTQDSVQPDDHITVASAIIPNFENLIIKFQSDKICLRQLTELLTFINYDLYRSDDYNDYYTTIMPILKELFRVSTDKELLENVANVFVCFSENRYYNRATVIMESIKHFYVKALTDDLKQLTATSERSLLVQLREESFKISILFAKFNLTGYLKWENIFQVWGNNYFKVLKYLLICCKWHLVWSLRQFMRPNNGNGASHVNHLLYNNCKDFIYGCLDMLKNANDSSESFLIFETLCDLYACFEKELKRKREFSNFVIEITEPSCQEILINFVVRGVIENTKIQVSERQKLLLKFVDVIFLGILPVESFSKILRFYHTHFEEFGAIMNHTLKQLNVAHPGLPLVIMHTLAEIYTQILSKSGLVNILTEDAKQLKFLAKKFAFIKELKSNNDILKLVNMSIYFAFRDEKNYPFLYFAKYFAKILNEDGKSDAHHLLKELVPEKDKNNDILLIFAKSLK